MSHQENFKNISEQAYGALQDYLKSQNMKTTDDLVKEVIQVLPPQEQQEILNASMLLIFLTCDILTAFFSTAPQGADSPHGGDVLPAAIGTRQVHAIRLSQYFYLCTSAATKHN